MERQVVGESLVLLCVVGTRSDAKVLDSRTDGFVLLQHLRQFPPQRVGHRQDVGHVRRDIAACKPREKPERRQSDLLLANEVRMQDPGKVLSCWTDATRRPRRFLQRGVNGVVLCLDAPRNFDLVRGHRLLPSPPSDAAVRFHTSASQVPYGLCRRRLYRLTHSTKRGGKASSTIVTRRTRSSFTISRAASRASSSVAYGDHVPARLDAVPRRMFP